MSESHIALEVSRDEHYKSPYLKSLKENWPSLAKDYRHYCHLAHPKVGEIWTWTSPEGQRFFHLILDEASSPVHDSAERLSNFKKAIKSLKRSLESEDLKTVQLPKIGFQFNADEMEIAQSLLKEVFFDTDVEIKFV